MAMTMPPLAVPSSLVSTSPRDAHRLVEFARLGQRVLPLIGVEHQQHLVRRAGIEALDDAPDLLQLLHQVRLAVQPPGGVGEHHVAAARPRRLQRIEHHRARVGAGHLRGEIGAPALRPHLELLDGGGAERIAGGEQHRLPLRAQRRASLPMVVVLPEPLTPTTRITNGRRAGSMVSGRAQGARISTMLPRSAAISAPTSASSRRATRVRSSSRMRSLACTPTSALIRRVSSSSRIAASICRPRNRSARS